MRRSLLPVALIAGALTLPAAASADVTLQPDTAPAGQFTRLDVRVPTERSTPTKRIVLELPPGFVFASYEPAPGWDVRVGTRKLTDGVRTPGGTMRKEVSRVSWTARSRTSAIPPGAFQDFGLAVRIPDGSPGTKLTFNATQTYQGGEVVHWDGSVDADTPAPQVTLSAGGPSATVQRASALPAPEQEDLPSRTLVIAALAAGGLGLLFGLAGLRSRS